MTLPSTARVMRAKHSGRCPACPFPIYRHRSWIMLHFDSGRWVHTDCMDKMVAQWGPHSE